MRFIENKNNIKDAPVQFETMQGQEINTPTDIMEKMEEAAINTVLPVEFVNSTYQTDFATRFTMSNTRFLKSIYTRQRKVEKIFSKIYTKIYNYEFNENVNKIEVLLPPPTYLTSTNNSQIIDNMTQMADKIIDTELATEDDDVKTEFKKLYIRETLSSYIDYTLVERLRVTARVNVKSAKPPKTENGEDSDINDVMDDEL